MDGWSHPSPTILLLPQVVYNVIPYCVSHQVFCCFVCFVKCELSFFLPGMNMKTAVLQYATM
jgi:hypothetical protein